jgi:hypothetical protein
MLVQLQAQQMSMGLESVTGGPYRLRHPMYLGELLLRLALLASVDVSFLEKAILLAVLAGIQIARIRRASDQQIYKIQPPGALAAACPRQSFPVDFIGN